MSELSVRKLDEALVSKLLIQYGVSPDQAQETTRTWGAAIAKDARWQGFCVGLRVGVVVAGIGLVLLWAVCWWAADVVVVQDAAAWCAANGGVE